MIYDPNKAVIAARIFVQEYIADQAEQSNLLSIAKDEQATVSYLARTSLAAHVITGIVTRAMIERWVMEAVASLAQQA